MRVRRITLDNWMCFRGEHVLELGSGAHAVVASYAGDSERSNWAGKTSLLEAIAFALFGSHRHRTDDEWISRGEPRGGVMLEFDDRSAIERTRARGKRSEVRFAADAADPDPRASARQDEAQRLLLERVGLDEEDFRATCLVGQRQAARIVLADPRTRMETVSAWFRLAPLERCEERARAQARVLADRLAVVEAQRADIRRLGGAIDEDEIRDQLNLADNRAADMRDRVAELQDTLAENGEAIVAAQAAADLARVVEEGKELAEEVKKQDVGRLQLEHRAARERREEALTDHAEAKRRHAQLAAVARGAFDGRCPVAGIECPATAVINGDRERSAREKAAAHEAFVATDSALHAADREENLAFAAVDDAQKFARRLEDLRDQAVALKKRASLCRGIVPQDPATLRADLQTAQDALQTALGRVSELGAGLRTLEASKTRLAALDAEAASLRIDLDRERQAVAVFGKGGAQRKVAEAALGEIQDGANDVLRACGADLSVAARWTREGQQLAKACDACGEAFPTSAKAKACARCGAARGPQLVHQLDFELSDRSGAAEDLVGIGLQLAAARWLRRERGARWSVALIDEPFSALDAGNRRGLGLHLAAMLAGTYGFDQSFVVAHHSDVLDALPHRIEIVRGRDGWSSVRGIA